MGKTCKNNLQRFLSLAASLLICVYAFPQTTATNPVVLYHITEENGLSDNHVQCVLKDHYGFVWIGTADGLNEMDGSKITVFKHDGNDTSSLRDNEILCLAEDKNGTIWIATRYGLSKYNRLTHSFTNWKVPTGPYGSPLVIESMTVDRDQNLWCASFGGLLLFNTAQNRFQSFHNNAGKDPEHSNRMVYVMLDRSGKLWICSFDGLWSFNTSSHLFEKEISEANDPLYEGLFSYVMEDHAGNIWAGCWSKGLKELERRSGKVINFSLRPGDPHTVNCITEIRQGKGNYVLLLNGALKGYDPGAGKFFQYARPLQLSEYPDVAPYYQSDDHWVWMISDNGLYIYNPGRQAFQHVVLNDLIVSQSLVFQEWKGSLLVGAQGRDFLKLYDKSFHPEKDFSTVLKAFPPGADGRNASVLSLLMEDESNLWAGTSDGVLHLDLNSGKSQWYWHRPGDSSSLPQKFVTKIFMDSQKQLWLFPWRGGIWKMNKADHGFYQALDGFMTEGDKRKKLLIVDAAEDPAGNIWMADLDEGIIFYQRSTGKFSKPLKQQTGERCHAARVFYRGGYCYSMVDKVFMKWKPDLSLVKSYPLPPQMDKAVVDFVPDNNGHWWMASRNGLIEFDESSQAFQRFTVADGLVSNNMDGSLFCRNDDTLLFAAQQYFTLFNPRDLLSASRSAPTAVLTDVAENGQWVSPDTTRPMEFDYQSNNLLFRWTITEYSDPFHNQFYCKLQGIDAGWRGVGFKGEVQYANLSPGKYELLLRGTTAKGISSKNILHIPFVVYPPFWKTWWFITLCAIAIIALVYALYRYRLKQALALERLRTKISTDLHDDIGSTLSSISILSDIVMKDISPGASTEMVSEIKDNSLSLMEKMDDIVWSINPRNDTLENLLLRVQRFAARLFEAKDIDYQIEIQDNTKSIRLPMDYRQHIYLIMKESINNLVKYSRAGRAVIQVRYVDDILEVRIEDNGVGFQPDGHSTGNGMISMKNRARLIKAGLEIDSQPGRGTFILLRLKIK